MTPVPILAQLLRDAAPHLAVGEFLEEAAVALEASFEEGGRYGEAQTSFMDYLTSINLPAVPISCANPHLEALAEFFLP